MAFLLKYSINLSFKEGFVVVILMMMVMVSFMIVVVTMSFVIVVIMGSFIKIFNLIICINNFRVSIDWLVVRFLFRHKFKIFIVAISYNNVGINVKSTFLLILIVLLDCWVSPSTDLLPVAEIILAIVVIVP